MSKVVSLPPGTPIRFTRDLPSRCPILVRKNEPGAIVKQLHNRSDTGLFGYIVATRQYPGGFLVLDDEVEEAEANGRAV